VRTGAGRLRARLAEYDLAEGKEDTRSVSARCRARWPSSALIITANVITKGKGTNCFSQSRAKDRGNAVTPLLAASGSEAYSNATAGSHELFDSTGYK
jgi:hypothetical protein